MIEIKEATYNVKFSATRHNLHAIEYALELYLNAEKHTSGDNESYVFIRDFHEKLENL